MARNVSILTLLDRIAQRADLENDERMTGDKLQVMLSAMNGELQLLLDECGCRYFESEATISANGASSYSLPSDHLATIGIERVMDGAGRRLALKELMIQERWAAMGNTGDAYWWALVGQAIELYPVPSSGTYKHLYVPQPADISTVLSSTYVDTVTPDGEEFLIYGVMVKALIGGEVDIRPAMVERDAARERLRDWAQQRSLITPRRSVLVTNDRPWPESGDWWPRG